MNKLSSVLIVDDDKDDCQLFKEGVWEYDSEIECLVARDGEQALEMLKNIPDQLPSIIFLDLRMPKFGGKRCLAELKKDELTKNIPVIIYSTSRSLVESAELRQMGAVHFITKPSNPEEIYYLLSVSLEENFRSQFNQQ